MSSVRFSTSLADKAKAGIGLHAQAFDGNGNAATQATAIGAAIHASKRGTHGIEFALVAQRLGKAECGIEVIDARVDFATCALVTLRPRQRRLDLSREFALTGQQ